MTILLKFEVLDQAIEYMRNYFKEFPPLIHDTEGKIYFQHNFYYLILNKFDWSNDE